MSVFVAVDFETFDRGKDSACQIGLVRVEGGVVVGRRTELIRPPRPDGLFYDIHKISWDMVKDRPVFRDVWADVKGLVEGAAKLVAHNAPFDSAVLDACLAAAGLPRVSTPWECTQRLSESRWGRGRGMNTLPAVCDRLKIRFERHHSADADAEAAARVYLALAGLPPPVALPDPAPAAPPADSPKPTGFVVPDANKPIWWFSRKTHEGVPGAESHVKAGMPYRHLLRATPLPPQADFWCYEGGDRWFPVGFAPPTAIPSEPPCPR